MVFFLCIVISSDRSPLKRAVNDFCWFVCTLRYLRSLCLTSVITLVESLTTVQSIENRGYMQGTDHYLFEGGGGVAGKDWVISKKKSYTAKTAESKIVQGEPWGQNRTSAFHFSVLKKNSCTSYCLSSNNHAQPKGEKKKTCSWKLSTPSPPSFNKYGQSLCLKFYDSQWKTAVLHVRKYLALESPNSAYKLWFGGITLYSFEWWFPMLLFCAMTDVHNFYKNLVSDTVETLLTV